MKKNVPNYWDYLNLKPLLTLQGGLENNEQALDTDELHFIVTHQALELWFKLILAELRDARDQLASPTVPEERIPHVVHHLGREQDLARAWGARGWSCPSFRRQRGRSDGRMRRNGAGYGRCFVSRTGGNSATKHPAG